MTLSNWSSLWNAIPPALGDHLWQSTVVVLAAALLTVMLRRNQAQIRYAVWLAASLKFLLPFSFLIALGSRFGWRHSSESAVGLYYAVEQIGEPFTRLSSGTAGASLVPASQPIHWLPILLTAWLCGIATVLAIWTVRWLRIGATVRRAVPIKEGRVYDALVRLQSSGLCSQDVQVFSSNASLEPGIFGIRQPVLLWPDGVSQHLDDAHLEAVIAHELCHVRRRDNLAAALHMLVEAVFWFHPLVWWIGSRLIHERERACDEQVLQLGSERHRYAESILKVCEFCLSSPLTCVSGVTGADLKKRMVHIMTDRAVHKLNFARKLLLWTAACLAIALPIAFGLFNATPSRADALGGNTLKFATVTIKPHISDGKGGMMSKLMMSQKDASLTAANVSAHALLQLAYRIQDPQVKGEPDWFKSDKYDIEAKVDPATANQFFKIPEEQRAAAGQHMLRQLLADYFKVSLHQESVDLPVYELEIADGGSKLQKSEKRGNMRMGMGELSSEGTHLDLLTAVLSQHLGMTVVDKTGLQGNYAFNLQWTPDADEMARLRAAGFPLSMTVPGLPAHRADAPPLATAVQEQLGLKLQPVTTRVGVLVIDHAEEPQAN